MVWITAEVDVDLDEFSDEEIRQEYADRKLGEGADPDEMCQRAYVLYHQGKQDEAHAILWELCLDRVNRVL
jgi:hypothetical protein